MSVTMNHIQDQGELLSFKSDTTLQEFSTALKSWGNLIRALEHREPTYQEFTAWLLKEGYVTERSNT